MATFTGNINLLVAAPMLQDALVDKDGTPMAGGTVTCWHDNSRTTLKNWYYQSGMPGNYSYITLPNPLTLSAAGTICDINGVDTIPFFYPYDENDEDEPDPYYISIVNYFHTNQITRENFPFLGNQSGSLTTENTFNNLITNGYFWRNIQPNTVNTNPPVSVGLQALITVPQGGTNFAYMVSPSQHDGFRMPDCQFQMNVNSGTDTVTFIPFSLGFGQPANNAILPEYYLSHNCTNSGSGVTQKFYQFPIALHVNSLDNVPFSFSILAQGTGTITIWILQDTGTGGGTSNRIELGSITLNSSWQNYTKTGIFSSSAGLTLGNGADDGWYLQIQMPTTSTSTVNFTKPAIYLTQNIFPSNDVQTYDQINSIISSPRTGDIRTSINNYYTYGWIPMNDGFIAKTVPMGQPNYARGNSDTFPLYNMIWTHFKPFEQGGSPNPICPMIDTTGTPINYGSTAYADFNANNALQLTKMMGRVMMGAVDTPNLLAGLYRQGVTITNAGGNIDVAGTNGSIFFQGQPVTFTAALLPANITANTIYYVTNITGGGAHFNLAATYQQALAGTPVIAFGSTGTTVIILTNTSGAPIGEWSHTQLLNEMTNHRHLPDTTAITNFFGQGAAGTSIATPGVQNLSTASKTGFIADGYTTQVPSNITQMATFYNFYIKL